ncbi:hypothetical protein D9C73_028455 [Collichthys lucidus]|uniref:EGF-like domain-containing protein n=1 Tax=Collichthys lucidus TaxID=240159 RepID=A0A4V6AMW0_COLLU|nr:hypothetical protein D9C73_028455 [Collichthys lucidus]
MVSPALLFLLLVSSSLFLSTLSVDGNDVERIKSKSQMTFNVISKIKDMAVPFLGLIEPSGTLIALCANLGLGLLGLADGQNEVIDVLRDEFEKLNFKMDKNQKEMKWEIWSAAAYSDTEKKINVAWDNYGKLLESLRGKSKEESKTLTEEFIKKYPRTATEELHKYLTTTGPSLMKNLAEMLGTKIKCDEVQIKAYTLLIDLLIYRGIRMNHLIYKLENTEIKEKFESSAKMAYESAVFMFNIHKSCLLNSDYIEEDVKEFIQEPKRRTKMARDVRSFMANKYERYDWMVVAYKTGHSQRSCEVFNQHTLHGFQFEVQSGDVSVALARQAKGNHTFPDKVKRAIERCLYNMVKCHDVAKKLKNCKENVEGIKRDDGEKIRVTDAVTAVHAYLDKSHAASNAKEAPDEYSKPDDITVPYIYTGRCIKYKFLRIKNLGFTGNFAVLIKSDEEILKKDPCLGLNCGGERRGTCVPVADSFVAMCECKEPYYGEKCEESKDDYKRKLEEER